MGVRAALRCSITSPSAGRLAGGALLWLGIAVMAVLLRGVQWDETYEHAQVLVGAVTYPDGHPVLRYVHGVFSIQPWLSAWMLDLTGSAAVVCGFRNVLALLAVVLPTFLITAQLSGRMLWGHIAACYALGGAFLSFDGSYPLTVWPGTFSNGPIGQGWALAGLWGLMARRWGAAAFLVLSMPAVHLGQAPVLFAVACVLAGMEWYRGDRSLLLRAWPYAVAGMFVTVCMAAYIAQQQVSVPESGVYSGASGDVQAIWRGYTFGYDPHRRIPGVNAHIGMFLALLVTVAGAVYSWRQRARIAAHAAVSLYAVVTVVAVLTAEGIHLMLGADTPFLLTSWMPYRLMNHLPTLGLGAAMATAAAIAHERQRLRQLLLFALFLILVLTAKPLLAVFMSGVYQRYVAGGEHILFLWSGAALVMVIVRERGWRGAWAMAAAAGGIGVFIALRHQYGGALLLLGAVAGAFLGRPGTPERSARQLLPFAAAALALFMVVQFYGQWRIRDHLPRSAFEVRVFEHFRDGGGGEAMIAASPQKLLFQARTGQPVFVESATSSYISYRPDLGPVIQRMYEDIYGHGFLAGAERQEWQPVWEGRTAREWGELSEAYGFRYVASPNVTPLNLPALFMEGDWTLYRVPSDLENP